MAGIRKRIGCDRLCAWEVEVNDGYSTLRDMDLTLFITDPLGNKTPIQYELSGDKTITFTWLGIQQKRLGEHRLLLCKDFGRPGQMMVDSKQFICLVPHTEMEDKDEVNENLNFGQVTLSPSSIYVIDKGASAYEIWLHAGNKGSESDFLKSLQGKQGVPGADGKNGKDGLPGATGARGSKGDPFTYEDFTAAQLAALKGKDGQPGKDGVNGKDGKDGKPGSNGLPGRDGRDGTDGRDGRDATINGLNTLYIEPGNNVTINQSGNKMVISASGGSGGGESYDDSELRDLIATKQDTISDLESIRSGAQAGTTALQPSQVSEVAKTGKYDDLMGKPTIPTVPTQEIAANTNARHTHTNKSVLDGITSAKVSAWNAKGGYSKPSGGIPASDLAQTVQTSLGKADTALQEHQDISGKQDTISDLESIRSGAAKGATALQSVPSTYRTAAAQNTIDATKADKADVYTKSEIDAMIGNVLNTPV